MPRRLLALVPLLALALSAAPSLPPKEQLHLFLLAGQFNTAGRGAVAGLSAAEACLRLR